MFNRRSFLKSVGASTVAGGVSAAATTQMANKEDFLVSQKSGRPQPPINMDRVFKVMAEEQLDALIVTRPINFYHFTGYMDHMSLRMDSPTSFAIICKDPQCPSAVIMNQFIYYYSVVDNDFDWNYSVNLFSGWAGSPSEDAASGNLLRTAAAPFYLKSKNAVAERAFETSRLRGLQATLEKTPPYGDPAHALGHLMQSLSLTKSRVGIDHPVTEHLLMSQLSTMTIVNGDHALRRIRLIKSPQEIDLMRRAAGANADAALAAAKALRSGATMREFRAQFFSECSVRGNTPKFIQIDTIMSETVNNTFLDGAAFAIDAVSQYGFYTGDYGRTVCIGEPSKTMRKATDAISLGWDAVTEMLKPGVRYSEIRRVGRAAIKKAGYDLDVAVTPHSVGLCHTDEPGRSALGYWEKDDLILEKDMIISVDMPVLHTGIGGSAHLEDLTLITESGSEPINATGNRVIQV